MPLKIKPNPDTIIRIMMKFKGVNKELIDNRYSEKKLNLSYSSMKLYYQCPFYFYAEKVLGLGEYETTLATRLGTYSHAVLERSYQEGFDFEQVVEEEISKKAISLIKEKDLLNEKLKVKEGKSYNALMKKKYKEVCNHTSFMFFLFFLS